MGLKYRRNLFAKRTRSPDDLLTTGESIHNVESAAPLHFAPDPSSASEECFFELSPVTLLTLPRTDEINTMNTSENEPSRGLNARLRPRKSNVHSSQSIRATPRRDAKGDRNKKKASPNKPDDLTIKSDSSSTPQLLCPYCERKFASKQTLSKHARRTHLSLSKQRLHVECLFCNHTDFDLNYIIRHMVDSHPNHYFACLNCHARFSSTSELADHKVNICEKRKPYRNKSRSKEALELVKKNQRTLNIQRGYSNEKKEYPDVRGFNAVVISCELKPSQIHDEDDIEDNIRTNLILPPGKSLTNSVIEKNAVIVLDDIQWNKRIPSNFSFHNTDADQILSRLGVVHRSPRTGDSTKRDYHKITEEATQKFEKCFDTSFYSKVASNVQENLSKFLDGSFNFNPDADSTIKTRKAKNSVVINTAEGFPILLAFEQFSRNLYDTYLPRVLAPKYKWKWDNLDSDKNCLSPDQIKRDSHTHNCIITFVSCLDIWTQLRMRRKFEDRFSTATEKKIDRQSVIGNELKDILESREIPRPTPQIVAPSAQSIHPRSASSEFQERLGLMPLTPSFELQPAVLSGEWVRPRCYVCCACGAQARDSRALSLHISSLHPNAQVQSYEIVGELLLNADILKHLYVPPSQIYNRSRPLRGFRECTKCNKSISLEDLHQHMLDCAGDTPTVRRKCRYRPFGVRRRRPRLPDNTIRKKIRKDIRRQTRQKTHMRSRPKIRSEVGDAETIRKMLADLPAKRHRVLINPTNSMLRPRKKLDRQRNLLIMKRRSTDDLKSRKQINKDMKTTPEGRDSRAEKRDSQQKNEEHIDDEDNKPLKCRRLVTKNQRQNQSIKRKTIIKRTQRRVICEKSKENMNKESKFRKSNHEETKEMPPDKVLNSQISKKNDNDEKCSLRSEHDLDNSKHSDSCDSQWSGSTRNSYKHKERERIVPDFSGHITKERKQHYSEIEANNAENRDVVPRAPEISGPQKVKSKLSELSCDRQDSPARGRLRQKKLPKRNKTKQNISKSNIRDCSIPKSQSVESSELDSADHDVNPKRRLRPKESKQIFLRDSECPANKNDHPILSTPEQSLSELDDLNENNANADNLEDEDLKKSFLRSSRSRDAPKLGKEKQNDLSSPKPNVSPRPTDPSRSRRKGTGLKEIKQGALKSNELEKPEKKIDDKQNCLDSNYQDEPVNVRRRGIKRNVSSPSDSNEGGSQPNESSGERHNTHRYSQRGQPVQSRSGDAPELQGSERGGSGSRRSESGGPERGGLNNRDGQNPSSRRENRPFENQRAPISNTPLKHSIASLTANSETHDKSVQFHQMFLIQQECNNGNEHVPTGHELLFENEGVIAKLDKPPLFGHKGMETSTQKNKINKPRKGLNDCINMLKNKLVDPIPSTHVTHISVQCGTDEPLYPTIPGTTKEILNSNCIEISPHSNSYEGKKVETSNNSGLTTPDITLTQQSHSIEKTDDKSISINNESYSGNTYVKSDSDYTKRPYRRRSVAQSQQLKEPYVRDKSKLNTQITSEVCKSNPTTLNKPTKVAPRRDTNNPQQKINNDAKIKTIIHDNFTANDISPRKIVTEHCDQNLPNQKPYLYATPNITTGQDRNHTFQKYTDHSQYQVSKHISSDHDSLAYKNASLEEMSPVMEMRLRTIRSASVEQKCATVYDAIYRPRNTSNEKISPSKQTRIETQKNVSIDSKMHGTIFNSDVQAKFNVYKSSSSELKPSNRSQIMSLSPWVEPQSPQKRRTSTSLCENINSNHSSLKDQKSPNRQVHLFKTASNSSKFDSLEQKSPQNRIVATENKETTSTSSPNQDLTLKCTLSNQIFNQPVEASTSKDVGAGLPKSSTSKTPCDDDFISNVSKNIASIENKSGYHNLTVHIPKHTATDRKFGQHTSPGVSKVSVTHQNSFNQGLLIYASKGSNMFSQNQNLVTREFRDQLSKVENQVMKVPHSSKTFDKASFCAETVPKLNNKNDHEKSLQTKLNSDNEKSNLQLSESPIERDLHKINVDRLGASTENVRKFADIPPAHASTHVELAPLDLSGKYQTPPNLQCFSVQENSYILENYGDYETLDLSKKNSQNDSTEIDDVVDLRIKSMPNSSEQDSAQENQAIEHATDLSLKLYDESIPTDLSVKGRDKYEPLDKAKNNSDNILYIQHFSAQNKSSLNQSSSANIIADTPIVKVKEGQSSFTTLMEYNRERNVKPTNDSEMGNIQQGTPAKYTDEACITSDFGIKECIVCEPTTQPYTTADVVPTYSNLQTTKIENTTPVYTLANACISVTKIETSTALSLTSTLLTATPIPSTTSVCTSAGTTIGMSLKTSSPLPVNDDNTNSEDNKRESASKTLTTQSASTVKEVITDINNADVSIEQDPDTARKIAMLPKELVEILGTMPIDHRKQLLNVLPQYVSTTKDITKDETTDILQNTPEPLSSRTSNINLTTLSESLSSAYVSTLHDSVLYVTPKTCLPSRSSITVEIDKTPCSADMSLFQRQQTCIKSDSSESINTNNETFLVDPINSISEKCKEDNNNFDQIIDLTEDESAFLPAQEDASVAAASVTMLKQEDKILPNIVKSNVLKANNDNKTASLRAVRIKTPAERRKSKSLDNQIKKNSEEHLAKTKNIQLDMDEQVVQERVDTSESLAIQQAEVSSTQLSSKNVLVDTNTGLSISPNDQQLTSKYESIEKLRSLSISSDDINIEVGKDQHSPDGDCITKPSLVTSSMTNENNAFSPVSKTTIDVTKNVDINSDVTTLSITRTDRDHSNVDSVLSTSLIQRSTPNKIQQDDSDSDDVSLAVIVKQKQLDQKKTDETENGSTTQKNKTQNKKQKGKKNVEKLQSEFSNDGNSSTINQSETLKTKKTKKSQGKELKEEPIETLETDFEINEENKRDEISKATESEITEIEIVCSENTEQENIISEVKAVANEVALNEVASEETCYRLPSSSSESEIVSKYKNTSQSKLLNDGIDLISVSELKNECVEEEVKYNKIESDQMSAEIIQGKKPVNTVKKRKPQYRTKKLKCSVTDRKEDTKSMRRSRRGKSLFVDNIKSGLENATQPDTTIENRTPLTKKQLIFSKLLLDEENNLKSSECVLPARENIGEFEKELPQNMASSSDNNNEQNYSKTNKPTTRKKSQQVKRKYRNTKEINKGDVEPLQDDIEVNKVSDKPAAETSEVSDNSTKPKKSKSFPNHETFKCEIELISPKKITDTINKDIVTDKDISVEKVKSVIPARTTTCYNVPYAAKRTRSKSVCVKSSGALFYDPYDIDLDDMDCQVEPLRKRNSFEEKCLTKLKETKVSISKKVKEDKISVAPVVDSEKATADSALQEHVSDSDDSSKSDVPLKKYISEKENKDLTSRTIQQVLSKNEASSKDIEQSDAPDKVQDESVQGKTVEEIRSEQFMQSFGFFSERKPRKSNLLATKKISETFHNIANENDDLYFEFKTRSNKKSLHCDERKSIESDINVNQQMHSKKACKRGRSKAPTKPLRSYCRICKKEFRRPDNYLRHLMTLLHISKLSEVELKVKTAPVHEEPNYLIAYKQQIDLIQILKKKIAKRKKNSKAPKITLPTIAEILENVKKTVREQELARRALSTDEELFIDCCELLKESHKTEMVHTDVPLAARNISNVGAFTSQTTTLGINLISSISEQNFDMRNDEEVDLITAKNILESEEVRNLENDLITGLKEAAKSNCNNLNNQHLSCPETMPIILSGLSRTSSDIIRNEIVMHSHKPQYVQSLEDSTTNKSKKSFEIKEKMYPDTIDNIDMFEDKFDKIKRKSRSQAAAAKQIQSVVETTISKKVRRKTDKKKGKKRTKKSRKNTVLTKGALKGFDGIKVSIPTSDINMSSIVSPLEGMYKRKKRNNGKKKRVKQDSESSGKCDHDYRAKDAQSQQKVDVYEFMDNDDAELFEFRPSTLMERFKSINSKEKTNTTQTTTLTTPKNITATEAEEDSTASSSISSDGDDFVYMSDDYMCSDDETENSLMSCEMSNGKTINDTKKKRKDVVEKNAVMGKIFKNNAVRAEKKTAKSKDPEKPKANLDQLFDSLLEKDSSVPEELSLSKSQYTSLKHYKDNDEAIPKTCDAKSSEKVVIPMDLDESPPPRDVPTSSPKRSTDKDYGYLRPKISDLHKKESQDNNYCFVSKGKTTENKTDDGLTSKKESSKYKRFNMFSDDDYELGLPKRKSSKLSATKNYCRSTDVEPRPSKSFDLDNDKSTKSLSTPISMPSTSKRLNSKYDNADSAYDTTFKAMSSSSEVDHSSSQLTHNKIVNPKKRNKFTKKDSEFKRGEHLDSIECYSSDVDYPLPAKKYSACPKSFLDKLPPRKYHDFSDDCAPSTSKQCDSRYMPDYRYSISRKYSSSDSDDDLYKTTTAHRHYERLMLRKYISPELTYEPSTSKYNPGDFDTGSTSFRRHGDRPSVFHYGFCPPSRKRSLSFDSDDDSSSSYKYPSPKHEKTSKSTKKSNERAFDKYKSRVDSPETESSSVNAEKETSIDLEYRDDAFERTSPSDQTGVAIQRARRKCTVGKQNVLAETWSSESEPDDAPPRPRSAESVMFNTGRKKKGRKKEGNQHSGRRGKQVTFKPTTVTAGDRSDEREEALAEEGPSDTLDRPGVSKPKRLGPYSWSAEDVDHLQEQHGWIVGDSHKKLVTMLAHAKGRKRTHDDRRRHHSAHDN